MQYPTEGLVFVNVYDEPHTPPVTPQEPAPDTGDHTQQLVWAVVAGVSCVAVAGMIGLQLAAKKRGKHDDSEEA